MFDLSPFQSRELNDRDFEYLEQILEKEKRGFVRTSFICVGICTIAVTVGLLSFGYLVMMEVRQFAAGAATQRADWQHFMAMAQVAGVFAAILGSFTKWWDAKTHVSAFDRVLLAVRARHQTLFLSLAPSIANAKKQPLWRDLITGLGRIFIG